jgi:hypothetical protein
MHNTETPFSHHCNTTVTPLRHCVANCSLLVSVTPLRNCVANCSLLVCVPSTPMTQMIEGPSIQGKIMYDILCVCVSVDNSVTTV